VKNKAKWITIFQQESTISKSNSTQEIPLNSKIPLHLIARTLLVVVISIISAHIAVRSQTQPSAVSNLNRERGMIMLREIKEELKKGYYDPNFHNMDLDVRFTTAEDKIKTAASTPQIFGIIAQVLQDLGDSHTFFIPPSMAYTVDYGWDMKIVGERVYVSDVDKGSDAELKGVKPGDEVLKAGGYVLGRKNLWTFRYLYLFLRPQPFIRATVQSPGGEPRDLELLAKVTEGKRVTDLFYDYFDLVRKRETYSRENRDRYYESGRELFIWKMNEFELENLKVDDAFEKVRNFKSLVLDLRANGGGLESTMVRVLENLFDHDVKIGDFKSRKSKQPLIAKTRGEKTFKGKLIVLIDSQSASAAEITARVVQLEKRGVVIGDQSSGSVMRSKQYQRQIGIDEVIIYGVSITDSDIVMADGNSLEKKGVIPDEVVLPTASDIAAGRDPVLTRAALLAGVVLDPEKAGAIFPRKQKSN
jgi:C-terminal processing protease CtpA/Prc